jgi:hypothetical protein
MIKNLFIFILATTSLVFFIKARTSDANATSAHDSLKTEKCLKPAAKIHNSNYYSKFIYNEAGGAVLDRVIIENSYPKSGIQYTAPDGKKYVYAVFWTRFYNQSSNPIELNLDFSQTPFEIPAASGNFMKLLFPPDTMTHDKEPLYDYGLEIKPFLDRNRENAASLKRTIKPKESIGFYVVALSNKGVNGTIRTGLSLKGKKLYYRVNDTEVLCGELDLKTKNPKGC